MMAIPLVVVSGEEVVNGPMEADGSKRRGVAELQPVSPALQMRKTPDPWTPMISRLSTYLFFPWIHP